MALWFAVTPAHSDERVVFRGSSAFYDRIFVVDTGAGDEEPTLRALRFDSLAGKNQTLIRPGHPGELPMPYLRSAAVALPVPEQLRRMLVIGLGGGAFPNFVRARMPDVQIDAVEIDPVVAGLARDYFGLVVDDMLSVHVEDGVDFIARTPHAYDYILLDAYDADAIPEALATAEFFRSVKARLTPGGVVVANLSIRSDRHAAVMIRRMARQFADCIHLRSPPHYNDVILLAQHALPAHAALREAARRFDTATAPHTASLGLDVPAATAHACAL